MAHKEIYAIYDMVKEEMGQLNLYKNKGEAVRAYNHAMIGLDDNPQAPANSDDYRLYKIGLIDDETMRSTIGDPERVVVSVGDAENE